MNDGCIRKDAKFTHIPVKKSAAHLQMNKQHLAGNILKLAAFSSFDLAFQPGRYLTQRLEIRDGREKRHRGMAHTCKLPANPILVKPVPQSITTAGRWLGSRAVNMLFISPLTCQMRNSYSRMPVRMYSSTAKRLT